MKVGLGWPWVRLAGLAVTVKMAGVTLIAPLTKVNA